MRGIKEPYVDRFNDCYGQKLDVSNWWKEFQNEQKENGFTILASDRLTDDVLQLLFGQLTVQEVLPLGLTCRRLYYHLKEAQKRTRELKLISTNKKNLPEGDFKIGNFRNVAAKLINTYPNLRCLSLASNCHPANISTLFTALPELPQLSTLSLTVDEFAYRNLFWRPLVALQSHASLRHLKISLLDKEPPIAGKYYAVPPLPILRQLTSFTFGNDAPYHNEYTGVVRALGKEGHGAHLTPGVGARLEVILFRVYSCSTPVYRQVSIKPALLLPYITLLDVAIGWLIGRPAPPNYQTAMATLFRSLPEMRQLQKLKLTIFSQTNSTDYPSLLAALSTLTALRTLTVEIDNFEKFSASSDLGGNVRLTSLPSVRFLKISLGIDSENDVHRWDLVECLQLVTCFPELHSFDCTFNVDSWCEKHVNSRHPQYAHCGLELARGVVELLPERIVKKVEVKFDGEYHFSSLEKLMAECRNEELAAKRREEEELAAKRREDEELAAKKKKNEMRKRHSSRKVANLRRRRCTFDVRK